MAVPRTAKPKAASSTSDEWNIVEYTVAADSALYVDKSTLTLRGIPALLQIQSVGHRWRWLVRHTLRARFVQRLYGLFGLLLKEEKAQPTLPLHRRKAIAKLWTSLQPYTSKYKGIKERPS